MEGFHCNQKKRAKKYNRFGQMSKMGLDGTSSGRFSYYFRENQIFLKEKVI